MIPARFFRGVTPRLIGVTASVVALCVTFAGSLATYRHYTRLRDEAARDLRILCGVIAPLSAASQIANAAAQPAYMRKRALDGVVSRLKIFQPDLTHFNLVTVAEGRELYRHGGELPELSSADRKSAVGGSSAESIIEIPGAIIVSHACPIPGPRSGYLVRVGVALPAFPVFLVTQASRDAVWILVTLILATVASSVLIGLLTRSLRNVTSYAEAIERGELHHKLEVRSTDEAGHIAEAFNSVLFKLRSSYVSTLGALAALLETRDRNTESHSQRGLKYAMELGKAAGLSPQALGDLEYGALLHDIGKVGIADHILRKTGPLTEEEWGVMRQHPTIGYNVLKHLDFLQNALPVVLHHQERWDGKGYPNGLAGEQIPLLARIFTIADSFDAMTSDRPYRRAMRPELAVQEMRRNGGNQFDPRLVELFVALWESGQLGRLDAASGASPAPVT